MPLYGHELDETIDPYQAGLGFACNLKDRTFVGKESLEQKAKDQSLPKRVGLILEGRRAARQGAERLGCRFTYHWASDQRKFLPNLRQTNRDGLPES